MVPFFVMIGADPFKNAITDCRLDTLICSEQWPVEAEDEPVRKRREGVPGPLVL